MINFEGKSVLVTAAAGGIGTALCQCFQAAGAYVIAIDSNASALDATPANQHHHIDMTDYVTLEATLNNILATHTPYAVLSNLGWSRDESLQDITNESLLHEININLIATMRLARHLLPAMSAKGEGNFVFTSSVNATAYFGNPTYSAAKSGIEAFARAVAAEYGPKGLRANCVAPGSVRTYAWDHRFEADPEIEAKVSALYPLGRMVTPMEVAQSCAFLASPLASGITGTTLHVDGGLLAANLSFLNIIAPDREAAHG